MKQHVYLKNLSLALLLIAILWSLFTLGLSGLQLLNVVVLIGASAFVLTKWLAPYEAAKQLENLNDALEQTLTGERKAHLEVDESTELGLLNSKFNHLLDLLHHRESCLKQMEDERESFQSRLKRKIEDVNSRHQRQLHHLTIVNRLSATLIGIFDPNEILKQVLTSIQDDFEFSQAIYCVLDEKRQVIEGLAGIGLDQEQILRLQFPWEATVFTKLLSLSGRDKMERGIDLLNGEGGIYDKFIPLFGEGSHFTIFPLMDKNWLSGLLAINHYPFTPDILQELLPSLKMLVSQTALAMANTRLYNEVNRINVNLAQRVDEISTLNEVGQLMNSILDLEDLLDLFIHVVTKEMRAENGSIMMLNTAGNILEIRVARGLDDETIKNTRVRLGEGISGWVALNREPLLIKDIEKDKRFSRLARHHYQTKSLMCVPIISKKEVIGVVNINNRLDGGEFSKSDLEFLKTLAAQAAVSLENAQLYENLQSNYYDTIKSLVLTLEAKDPYTRGHSQRVTEYVLMMGRALGVSQESLERLEYAGILHDIGKIGISEYLLSKQGRLTTDEYHNIQKHPLIGESIIEPIEFLANVRPVIRHHHERFDGQGYPDNLEGEANTLEARILSIADAYDAMTSNRPYRKALASVDAIRELKKNSGTQFDSRLVDIFTHLLENNITN